MTWEIALIQEDLHMMEINRPYFRRADPSFRKTHAPKERSALHSIKQQFISVAMVTHLLTGTPKPKRYFISSLSIRFSCLVNCLLRAEKW